MIRSKCGVLLLFVLLFVRLSAAPCALGAIISEGGVAGGGGGGGDMNDCPTPCCSFLPLLANVN
jgi:hypothetical protein